MGVKRLLTALRWHFVRVQKLIGPTENWFSFFKWWEMSADELEKKFNLDDNGTDKFSRAIVDELWAAPSEWYDYDDGDDSDSDDSDDADDEDESESEGDM